MLPENDNTNYAYPISNDATMKEIFWDNNISLLTCIAMILGEDINTIQKSNPHFLLYGKYLGGFAYEGFELLPPLCILQVLINGEPRNTVYYNRKAYDPMIGIFNIDDYVQKKFQVVSYIQIFIPEAYENVDWKPEIPSEIKVELEKDKELKRTWDTLTNMQQSKILNYIYPFSKASSLNKIRIRFEKIKTKQIESIVSHIKAMSVPNSCKSVWEELDDFETIEAVETLRKCGITKGATVLDMGCGHGHYTIPASIAVGENGCVIGVDLNKKVVREAELRVKNKDINNVVFINTNEYGLENYICKIDFLILYDVLHGYGWKEQTLDIIKILYSLLRKGGILSLAMYSEIERVIPPNSKQTPKGHYSTIPISHKEAIEPYIKLMESCGFKLSNLYENGGVHFDNFHSPYHWRKYGEVRISSLERRNIYNFIKI